MLKVKKILNRVFYTTRSIHMVNPKFAKKKNQTTNQIVLIRYPHGFY